jgi:hypothetical protein
LRALGINSVGLSRAGFTDEDIAGIVSNANSGKFVPNLEAALMIAEKAGSA